MAAAGIWGITAATSQETQYWDHYWTCLGYMITSPDLHATECSPGVGGDGNSLSGPVTDTDPGGGPPVTITVTTTE